MIVMLTSTSSSGHCAQGNQKQHTAATQRDARSEIGGAEAEFQLLVARGYDNGRHGIVGFQNRAGGAINGRPPSRKVWQCHSQHARSCRLVSEFVGLFARGQRVTVAAGSCWIAGNGRTITACLGRSSVMAKEMAFIPDSLHATRRGPGHCVRHAPGRKGHSDWQVGLGRSTRLPKPPSMRARSS